MGNFDFEFCIVTLNVYGKGDGDEEVQCVKEDVGGKSEDEDGADGEGELQSLFDTPEMRERVWNVCIRRKWVDENLMPCKGFSRTRQALLANRIAIICEEPKMFGWLGQFWRYEYLPQKYDVAMKQDRTRDFVDTLRKELK